jgi:hypothetical protein
VGGGGATEPDQNLELTISGEALTELNQGRLLAYGSNWYPIKLLGPILPSPRLPRSLQRPRILDWLQSRWHEKETEPHIKALVVMPMAIASQVCTPYFPLSPPQKCGILLIKALSCNICI